MSGKSRQATISINADRGSKEKNRTDLCSAGSEPRTPVDELMAGDIGCTVKLKDEDRQHS